jgi:hypothetical protein
MPLVHSVVFMVVSMLAMSAVVQGALALRRTQPSLVLLSGLCALTLLIAQVLANSASNSRWPWPVYSSLAALLLPPVLYRMTGPELVRYEVLASLSSPAIHLAFSFCFGWSEYLPFWRVPPAWVLLSTL